MLDLLILFLFLLTGAAAGWLGFDFVPLEWFKNVNNQENLKIIIPSISGFLCLLLGFLFQELRKKLTSQIKRTPTDLLISRAIGLILGLLVGNLVLAPILLLPLSKEIIYAKPLAAVLSNMFLVFLVTI